MLQNNEQILLEYVEDVKDGNRKLYQALGHGTESIAYPGGIYTPRLDNIMRINLGYTTTFTTDYGLVKTNYDILTPMKRVYRVLGDTAAKIEGMINSLK